MGALSFSTMPPPPTPLIGAWAAAIYTMEDVQQNAIATRQNNPGNIVSNSVFATYLTMAAGWQALYADLAAKIRLYPGYTFEGIMSCNQPGVTHCYAPGSIGYGNFVANQINQALGTSFTGQTTLAAAAAGVDDSAGLQTLPDGGSGDAADYLVFPPDSTIADYWPWAAAALLVVWAAA